MVTHKIETVVDADNIIVINNGSIVDSGSYEKLMNECELFKDMWDKQVNVGGIAQ